MTINFLPRFTRESFSSNRPLFYILVLIIGACLTDSPSGKEQVMIAVPLMLLFEWTSLLIDRFSK